MKEPDKKTFIAEEVFVVQHSGEIPEVTFHESLHYLTKDPDGPALKLDTQDVIPLKHAVVKRYREIILRDLNPENRDKGIYRGLGRCSANWKRFREYCTREKLGFLEIQAEVAKLLQEFLQQETADVLSGNRSSCVNCSQAEIEELAISLGLSTDELPEGWQGLC